MSLSPSPQQWLILAAFAVVAIFLLFARRRAHVPRQAAKNTRQESADVDLRHLEQVRGDIEKLLVQLDRLSTGMNEQLEKKNAELRDAVKDADQRIFALRALVQVSRIGEEEACDDAPSAASSVIAKPAAPARSATTDLQPPPYGMQSRADARTQRIYDLADQGLTPREIAQRLEDHVGEVDLILQLRSAANRL